MGRTLLGTKGVSLIPSFRKYFVSLSCLAWLSAAGTHSRERPTLGHTQPGGRGQTGAKGAHKHNHCREHRSDRLWPSLWQGLQVGKRWAPEEAQVLHQAAGLSLPLVTRPALRTQGATNGVPPGQQETSLRENRGDLMQGIGYADDGGVRSRREDGKQQEARGAPG